MHKYRSASRRQAWYSEDGSNYNPFQKLRTSKEPFEEPDGDEPQDLSDDEDFIPKLIRRFTWAQKDPGAKPAKPSRKPQTALGTVDEEVAFSAVEPQAPFSVDEEEPGPQRKARAAWQQLRKRVTGGSLGEKSKVKPAVAVLAASMFAHAPGQLSLGIAPRQSQAVVIELNKATPNENSRPKFFVFSKEATNPGKEVLSGLRDLQERRQRSDEAPRLRVIYVQDDVESFKRLITDFRIDSPAFNRNRTKFLDWILGQDIEHLSTWQTAFWRPSFDRSRGTLRAAFGLEYLVPHLKPVSVIAGHARLLRKRKARVVSQESDDDHDDCLQRLTVYIQLSQNGRNNPAGAESSKESFKIQQQDPSNLKMASESTVVILDSSNKALVADPLIGGEEPWHQLLDGTDHAHPLGDRQLAAATIELTFEAIASRWSQYILYVHDYMASLEEQIYGQPADDSRANELWSISKQLLQAERLLKFHILLLENVQNDLKGSGGIDHMPDSWLRTNLDEFKRLNSEVEETLKKPMAQMIDLVSRPSIIHRFY
ncbi:MAG: hypothetical protein Q9167_005190 [Letrouitia subvulpina]